MTFVFSTRAQAIMLRDPSPAIMLRGGETRSGETRPGGEVRSGEVRPGGEESGEVSGAVSGEVSGQVSG